MPPTSREPSTISIGALVPTSRASAGSSTATAEVPAIRRVTRPSASVTTSRVRTGSRLPRSTPMVAPSRTVATFTTVPVPAITGLLCRGRGG